MEEEAGRMMRLAEQKFNAGDLKGAWMTAERVKTLFPSFPGLDHNLAAYRVHVFARKIDKGAIDWYAVLGVCPSSDPDCIREQFKKLRFLTHPDKNASAAADGAFKLVMEAWSRLPKISTTTPSQTFSTAAAASSSQNFSTAAAASSSQNGAAASPSSPPTPKKRRARRKRMKSKPVPPVEVGGQKSNWSQSPWFC